MILALKTAAATTQIWLFANAESSEPLAHTDWESGRDLSEQLLGRIIDLLAEAQATTADLTGIIVFSGPGSFTSLRIGHTVANALADSLGIPVVGASDSSAGADDWVKTARAQLATTRPGRPALPHYGSEAHITRPKS